MVLGISKPTVGASNDTWGTLINSALDAIVAYINSLTASSVGAVPTATKVAGHALTGDVSLDLADLTGKVSLGQLAAGGTFYVYKNGANWVYPGAAGATITARPTSRTDVTMESFSTDGTAPPFAVAGLDIANTVPS